MKLSKELGLSHVFSICSGAMLSGLFILPGLAYERAGPALLASYVLAGALALAGMLSQAELSSAMPKAGGTYFYVTRSMGPAVGAVYGLITWVSLALKSAYELLFMGLLASALIHLEPHVTATIICLGFMAINIVGVREAGRLQVVLVTVILLVLFGFVALGLPSVDVLCFKPFMPHGALSVFTVAGFIFISFGGLLKIASLGEEVREPGRVLPRGMILSFCVVMIAYLTVVFVTLGNLGGATLSGSLTPLSDGAGAFVGTSGRTVVALAAVLAVISAANTGVMSASRYPLALARDGMLPAEFERIGRRFRTPHYSILATGAIVIAALFLPLDALVKAASSVLILTYLFTCLAVVILREGRLQNYQPHFRAPLYPFCQIVGIVGFLLLLVAIGREALISSALLLVVGLVVCWFFGRSGSIREYALLHLIERVTDAQLTERSLETELKEIIRERDDMLKDRFDLLVEECHVLDIRQPVGAEEFFRMAAVVMSKVVKAEPDLLFERFTKREEESSTVLNPFLAIPHVIIEGEGEFDLLIARCREGIRFSDEVPHVHAVFLLVGTRDERPFHLRALAAIAQIVQDPSFDERWMSARNGEELKDILLLSARKRHTTPEVRTPDTPDAVAQL